MEIVSQFADSPGKANPPSRIQPILYGILLVCLPGCSGCETPATDVEREVNTTSQSPETIPEPDEAASTSPEPETGNQEPKAFAPVNRISEQAGSSGETKGAADRQTSSTTATTPSAALQQARDLHRASQRLASAGNPGGAYHEASRAWQLVNQFPSDPACVELTRQLLTEMESLGEQANRDGAAEDASRMLMVR